MSVLPATATRVQPEATLQDVLEQVRSYHPGADLNLIQRAYLFAEHHHRPQRRKNGEPYISHPVAVARLLCDLKLDEEAICAALLHDTVEDTEATFEDLRDGFGEGVAELVDGVTKLSKIRFRSKAERQAENFRKMLLAMSRDLRVILVKLADRTHNMRTLHHLPEEKRAGIASETMDIYAPLANRLGLGAIKSELEDLSFRHLYPEDYAALRQKVEAQLHERRSYTDRVIRELRELLDREGVEAEVAGRPKHYWSIYQKMQRQGVPLEKIHDLIAFRVLVERNPDCYQTLGLIHDHWRPVPGRFKDYIALPKANKYQSLHTTVIGPDGQPIEIQIRTWAMHRVAEGGIAAHWKYKQADRSSDGGDEERFDWLKQLMEWQQELDDPTEFLESVKVELFQEEVYTFTPRGELKVLPRGSTPVDFAYAIHSEIGDTCSGALVNGSMVPLSHPLSNGDVIEVLTSAKQRPSKDWLAFVRSSRAKNRIRSYIKKEQRQRSYELGEQLLDKELRRYSRSLARIRRTPEFAQAVERNNVKTADELIVQVGSGKLTPDRVVADLLPAEVTGKPKAPASPPRNPVSRLLRRVTGGPTGVVVDGFEGVQHRIARCCSPVPGEPIIGYVTPEHAVKVHRRDCDRIVDMPPDREVEVRWGEVGNGYPVTLRVITMTGMPGTLSTLGRVFESMGVNIVGAKCEEVQDGRAENYFTFRAKDIDEINRIVRRFRALRGVYDVQRVRELPDEA